MNILEKLDNCVFDKYEKRGGLGISEIGNPCRRYLWYKYNNVSSDKKPDSQIIRIFNLGSSIESDLIADLKDAGFQITCEQAECKTFLNLDAGFGHIYGHIDGIIEYDGDSHILEIKSANDASFRRLKKCQSYEIWQPKYKAQIQGYMHATDVHDAIVIVYNKNNSELYSEKIEYDFNYMTALLKFVTDSVTAASAPQLFCGDKMAKYCEYQELCYGK